MIEVTKRSLEPSSVYERLSRTGAGSVVVHTGIVKPVVNGMPTKGIRFSAGDGLETELRALEATLRENWAVFDVLIIRRIGDLCIGDTILIAAISAENRETAFGACREAVESLKKLENIQKEELFISK